MEAGVSTFVFQGADGRALAKEWQHLARFRTLLLDPSSCVLLEEQASTGRVVWWPGGTVQQFRRFENMF